MAKTKAAPAKASTKKAAPKKKVAPVEPAVNVHYADSREDGAIVLIYEGGQRFAFFLDDTARELLAEMVGEG